MTEQLNQLYLFENFESHQWWGISVLQHRLALYDKLHLISFLFLLCFFEPQQGTPG